MERDKTSDPIYNDTACLHLVSTVESAVLQYLADFSPCNFLFSTSDSFASRLEGVPYAIVSPQRWNCMEWPTTCSRCPMWPMYLWRKLTYQKNIGFSFAWISTSINILTSKLHDTKRQFITEKHILQEERPPRSSIDVDRPAYTYEYVRWTFPAFPVFNSWVALLCELKKYP